MERRVTGRKRTSPTLVVHAVTAGACQVLTGSHLKLAVRRCSGTKAVKANGGFVAIPLPTSPGWNGISEVALRRLRTKTLPRKESSGTLRISLA